jgi:hypothetical protein
MCHLLVSKLGKLGIRNDTFQDSSSANGSSSYGGQKDSWFTCREMAVGHCKVF